MVKKTEEKETTLTDIEALVKLAEKSFGCYTGFGNDDKSIVQKVSSGIEFFDRILAGGFRRGAIHLLSGGFASGKTFMAQTAIAKMQKEKPNSICVYIDAEHRYDPEWFSLTGVDVSKLIVQRPSYGEQAMDLVIFWCEHGADIVVLDSLAALVPMAEDIESVEKQSMGQQARMLSKAFRKIVPKNLNTVLICINQLRQDIGNTYSRGILHKMPGGESQYFYAALIVDVRRGEYTLDKAGQKVGHQINCLVTKCNYAPPFGSCKIPLIYKTGSVDIIGAICNAAIDEGFIPKKGGWYYPEGKDGQPFQGLEALKEYYTANTEAFEIIKEQVYSAPVVIEDPAIVLPES
jgi:recombination protein RecA